MSKFKILGLIIAISLSACTALDKPRTPWVKHSIDEVTAMWGAPSKVEKSDTGGVYTWSELRYSKSGIKQCTKKFITNEAGIIKSGPHQDCHQYFIK